MSAVKSAESVKTERSLHALQAHTIHSLRYERNNEYIRQERIERKMHFLFLFLMIVFNEKRQWSLREMLENKLLLG